MSTHKVEVLKIKNIDKHPNADKLEIVRIDGFNCCVGLGQFKKGDLAIYIEPDYILPDKPEYAFLKGSLKIKSRKFRGEWSQGLLLPAKDGMKEGDNVMDLLGIIRYNPPDLESKDSTALKDLAVKVPNILKTLKTYDLENWRKYKHLLVEGESVVITEKIHGASAKFTFQEGKFWIGSRNQWKQNPELSWLEKLQNIISKKTYNFVPEVAARKQHAWSTASNNCPWIKEWCRQNRDYVLFGEIFGNVQNLKYGAQPGQIFFRAFDAWNLKTQKFMDATDFIKEFSADQRVPLLYTGAYSSEKAQKLALMEKSTLADHIGEGVVIKPAKERSDPILGRVALKLVSDIYLEKN